MEKWVEVRKGGNFEEWSKKFGISPVLARIIRNREITDEIQLERFLYGDRKNLYAPLLMKDMEKMVTILMQKIEAGAKIRVIGDYDIDGVCAAYLLKTGLEMVGACVDAVIPERIRDGYGLNEKLIEEAFADGVDTILTCDNGISAVEQVRFGKEKGMTFLITDHHEIPELLPAADAIVDPHQKDCGYPYASICGAVVGYKLIQALFEAYDKDGALWDAYLEIAAFATIGDIMELRDENRLIVKCGLAQMQNPHNRGLKALIEVCGLKEKEITPYHIGFVLGPCINATGRLETAELALELLEADTDERAFSIAKRLLELNQKRKDMTESFVQLAIRQVEESSFKEQHVYVVYLPECHESLAGIIAGRLRERYSRPVFVVTDGKLSAKGSGRSIECYDMYQEMTKVSDVFLQYGGHKMAAGFSIEKDRIDELRKRLVENETMTEEDLAEKVRIDLRLSFAMLSEKLIQELSLLEPCGNGNTKPVFATRQVSIGGGRIIGKNQNVYKGIAKDESGINIDCIYFGDAEAFQKFEQSHDSMLITYYPQINEYNGKKMLQIIIQKYR